MQPRWNTCVTLVGYILRQLGDDARDRAAKAKIRALVPRIVSRLADHRLAEMVGAHDMGVGASVCTFLWSLEVSLFNGKDGSVAQ